MATCGGVTREEGNLVRMALAVFLAFSSALGPMTGHTEMVLKPSANVPLT